VCVSRQFFRLRLKTKKEFQGFVPKFGIDRGTSSAAFMRASAALLLACAVQSSCGCMDDSLHDGNAMQPWHRTAS
jgi:hypothetical protein